YQDVVDQEVAGVAGDVRTLPAGLEVQQRAVRGRHGEAGLHLGPPAVGDRVELGEGAERLAATAGGGEAEPDFVGRLPLGEPQPRAELVRHARVEPVGHVTAEAGALVDPVGDQRRGGAAVRDVGEL